jgi:hypothetical protein
LLQKIAEKAMLPSMKECQEEWGLGEQWIEGHDVTEFATTIPCSLTGVKKFRTELCHEETDQDVKDIFEPIIESWSKPKNPSSGDRILLYCRLIDGFDNLGLTETRWHGASMLNDRGKVHIDGISKPIDIKFGSVATRWLHFTEDLAQQLDAFTIEPKSSSTKVSGKTMGAKTQSRNESPVQGRFGRTKSRTPSPGKRGASRSPTPAGTPDGTPTRTPRGRPRKPAVAPIVQRHRDYLERKASEESNRNASEEEQSKGAESTPQDSTQQESTEQVPEATVESPTPDSEMATAKESSGSTDQSIPHSTPAATEREVSVGTSVAQTVPESVESAPVVDDSSAAESKA